MKQTLSTSSAFALLLALAAGSVQAENNLKTEALSLNVPVNDSLMDGNVNSPLGDMPFMINGKYMLQNDMAVIGGFGLGIQGGDGKGTDIAFKAGVRKYTRVADFAPFMGANLVYASYNDSMTKDVGLIAEFGAEYFLQRQFSIEGAARAGYVSTDTDDVGNYNTIGTFGAGVSVNYYFK